MGCMSDSHLHISTSPQLVTNSLDINSPGKLDPLASDNASFSFENNFAILLAFLKKLVIVLLLMFYFVYLDGHFC